MSGVGEWGRRGGEVSVWSGGVGEERRGSECLEWGSGGGEEGK